MNSDSEPRIIIAIDGFSSSGKSTMAKELAKRIGYRYIDSGAMYRAVTLWCMRNGLIDDNGKIDTGTLIRELPGIEIDFSVTPEGQHTMLGGEDVESHIRSLAVSAHVSEVAAVPQVRHALVGLQQRFGREKGIVMDGRDIGTTVFPDAELKIFVDASAETRAQRRFHELRQKGDTSVTYAEVLENVRHRDHLDLTRGESPLRRAADAMSLDNSSMTVEQQNRWLIDNFERTIKKIKADGAD